MVLVALYVRVAVRCRPWGRVTERWQHCEEARREAAKLLIRPSNGEPRAGTNSARPDMSFREHPRGVGAFPGHGRASWHHRILTARFGDVLGLTAPETRVSAGFQ